MKVVGHITTTEKCRRQPCDGIRNNTIRVSIDDRYLVPLVVDIRPVASELSTSVVHVVDDARVLHILASRGLEIYVRRNGQKDVMQVLALAHCKYLPDATRGEGERLRSNR